MTEKEQDIDTGELHRSDMFSSGVRAVLSTVFFTAVGAVVGHFIGRWGEDVKRAESGMSAMLGRWITGGLFGGLAAYVSLRGSAEQEHRRGKLEEKNAQLEQRIKSLEAQLPEQRVHSSAAEHHGMIASPSLEKAL
jgi:hypothetical protein